VVIARLTGRRPVVLLTLVGVLLILLAGTRTWATVRLGSGFPGPSELTVSGRRTAPEAIAIALAAGAAAVVLAISGRIVRFLVAAGLVIAGAVVVLAGVSGARDTDAAFSTALVDSLRVTSTNGVWWGNSSSVAMTLWPWAAAVGGAMLVLAGLLALVGGRSWSGPTRRYEREPAPSGSAGSTRPAGSIDAAGSADLAEPGAPAPTAATWDALSRGEDPTSAPREVT
jgi:uncharacterized membrane protein (TIGR02234 family)